MSLDWRRYQGHLEGVSRSFSFCIARLESPFREWVGLAYLLCRVVDTIEDTKWVSAEKQNAAFKTFDRWLLNAPLEQEVQDWLQLFDPKSIPPEEWDLLLDGHFLFQQLHLEAPQDVQFVLLQLAQSMSQGMQHFQAQKKIQSLLQVNQYCFFVAGLVGEALCQLLSLYDSDFQSDEQTLLRAHHFGLFLQKVNLLKDQVKDEIEDRHLVPDRDLLKESVLEHAQQAWSFIESLPLRQQGFRVFCSWSLFIGLQTIPLVEKAFLKKQSARLPKLKTRFLIQKIERLERQPDELKALFQQSLADSGLMGHAKHPIVRNQNFDPICSLHESHRAAKHWLMNIYHGKLALEHLIRLGVIVEA